MSPPPSQTLIRALETLYSMSALDMEGSITEIGRILAEFPLEPQLAKCLLTAPLYGCVLEILTIIAMLSVPSVFTRQNGGRRGIRDSAGMRELDEMEEDDDLREKPSCFAEEESRKMFADPESDHITLLNIFDAYQRVSESDKTLWCNNHFLNSRSLFQAYNVREQLCSLVERLRIPVPSNRYCSALEQKRNVKRCLCHGFFMQSAVFDRDGNYRTAKDNQAARIHPSSTVSGSSQWVIYNELVQTTGNYLRTVTQVEGEWLAKVAPDYFDVSTFPEGRMKEELIGLYRKLIL